MFLKREGEEGREAKISTHLVSALIINAEGKIMTQELELNH